MVYNLRSSFTSDTGLTCGNYKGTELNTLWFLNLRFTTSGNSSNPGMWKPPFFLNEPKSVSWVNAFYISVFCVGFFWLFGFFKPLEFIGLIWVEWYVASLNFNSFSRYAFCIEAVAQAVSFPQVKCLPSKQATVGEPGDPWMAGQHGNILSPSETCALCWHSFFFRIFWCK